jgi:hypothetical protein
MGFLATSSDPATWWRARARETARRINLAWWLETLAAPLVIASGIASVAILAWRNHGSPGDRISLGAIILMIASVLAVACWLLARKKFESPAQSLVRIEAALGLHNALSAANDGIAAWPPPLEKSTARHPGLRWQWRRLAVPPTVALAALVAALWIPIGDGTAAAPPPPRQPLAWTQLDAELDALMESAVVEETYIEHTRERIEQLRARDPNEWYSHNTMEATDALAQAHRNEANRLEDALSRAQQAVERMREANPETRQRQFDEYQKALEDMANGAMQPNDELRQQLAEIDPDNLNQLTREQLEKLRDQLREANDALRDALQKGDGEPAGPGNDGDEGPMPGGGPGEDGGHEPGVLGNLPDGEVEAGEFTPLAARDLSNAALGDLLETQSSPHDQLDTAPASPMQGGDTTATGRGGDRIWRDALDPAEQRTLRKFFE